MVQVQKQYIDQLNIIDSPETSPHSYSQLVFDKDVKNTHLRKNQNLQQIVQGKLDIHVWKTQTRSLSLALY
jgi:hypothetical protein